MVKRVTTETELRQKIDSLISIEKSKRQEIQSLIFIFQTETKTKTDLAFSRMQSQISLLRQKKAKTEKTDFPYPSPSIEAGDKDLTFSQIEKADSCQTVGANFNQQELAGINAAINSDNFEDDRQAINAVNKLDENGRSLYKNNPKYRQWCEKTLDRSDVLV